MLNVTHHSTNRRGGQQTHGAGKQIRSLLSDRCTLPQSGILFIKAKAATVHERRCSKEADNPVTA